MEQWIERYGYFAVLIGTFLEGESALLLGGALAHRGLLTLQLVSLTAFVGAVLGDQTWFQVGRRYGPAFLARYPHLEKHHARAEELLRRWGDGFVICFRFVVGIRSITPLLLGSTTYRTPRFLALNLIGCALWSVAVGALGYFLGAGIKSLFERAGRVEELALAALVVGGVLFYVTRGWRGRERR